MGSHYNGLNLGLCYIAAVLNQRGHACRIYNGDYLDSEVYPDQVQLFNGIDSYKVAHSNSNHPIWQETVQAILASEPDFVGLSIFTADFPAARIVASLLKERRPETRVVVGGPHVTVSGGKVLEECPAIDYAVVGEGEFAMRDLVDGVAPETVPGLVWRRDGKVVSGLPAAPIEDLDALPFPDRAHFHPPGARYNTHFVLTSRGCPNCCTFCASPRIWNHRVHFRSIDSVVAELQALKDSGQRFVQFQDDTFTYRKERLLGLMDEMVKRELGLSWICDTRLTCIDAEILEAMKRAGCARVKVGIESGSPRILKAIRKGITPELALEKTALIKSVGLGLGVYFMIGFPGETNEDARQTIELAKRIGADYYSLSIVAPYLGTEIYNDHVASGAVSEKNHWEYFFHQSKELILTSGIDPAIVDEFLALNQYGKGKRI